MINRKERIYGRFGGLRRMPYSVDKSGKSIKGSIVIITRKRVIAVNTVKRQANRMELRFDSV